VFRFGGELGGCGGAGSVAYVLLDTCPVLLGIALLLHTARVALTWFIALAQAAAFPPLLVGQICD
jgi:hypothetical protein